MIHEFTRIDEDGASLEVEGSAISSFKEMQKTRWGLRRFNAGMVQTSSFVGQSTEDDLLNRALEQDGTSVPYHYDVPSRSMFERSVASPGLRGLPALHRHTAEALDFLRSKNDRFLYNGKATTSHVVRSLRNTQGVEHRIEYDSALWWLGFKHRDSRDIFDGYFSGYSLERFDFLDSVQRNLPLLEAFERRLRVPQGLQNIVFASPDQILGKLSESLRIDRYTEGACIYAGRLGDQAFNPKFSLYDVRMNLAGSVVSPFDGEGTLSVMDALPLIENGVFKNVICDLRSAKKYGSVTTGNGQRLPDSNAALGFNELGIGKGIRSSQAMLQGLDNCILVTMSMGGDSTDNGDLSLPVALAFQYKKGECLGRLDPFTLKSNVREMFGSRFLEAASDGHEKGALNPCVAIEMEVL